MFLSKAIAVGAIIFLIKIYSNLAIENGTYICIQFNDKRSIFVHEPTNGEKIRIKLPYEFHNLPYVADFIGMEDIDPANETFPCSVKQIPMKRIELEPKITYDEMSEEKNVTSSI